MDASTRWLSLTFNLKKTGRGLNLKHLLVLLLRHQTLISLAVAPISSKLSPRTSASVFLASASFDSDLFESGWRKEKERNMYILKTQCDWSPETNSHLILYVLNLRHLDSFFGFLKKFHLSHKRLLQLRNLLQCEEPLVMNWRRLMNKSKSLLE